MRQPLLVRTKNRPPHSRRCRPRVEQLEDRSLLSAPAYSFQVLSTLGDAVTVPTGPAFRIDDFEPGGLNNKGDVIFGNDLGTTSDPSSFFGEGVFLRSHGTETVLGSSNAPAPGGGAFDFGFEGPVALNEQGDAAVDFFLEPFSLPVGANAGAFRYSHSTGQVTPVVLPGITPVPGGGTFIGVSFGPALDPQGDLYFVGMIQTDNGVHVPDEPYDGLGLGIFKADLAGHITSVVGPGDPAPGGGTFDIAGASVSSSAWVSGRGDVVFGGHVAGEEASVPGNPPQAVFISAISSLYIKSGATGKITSIAHAGAPAPGGGVFRQAYFGGINNNGDVVFTGDLTPAPDVNESLGVFAYSGGKVIAIARPGDLVPGGGHFVTASPINGQTHINNQGDIVFNASLDTTHNGIPDTGLFLWSHGKLSLIARSGTVLPGVGTVDELTTNEIVIPPPPIVVPNSGANNNDRGQVLFAASLEDGRGVLLEATPSGNGRGGTSASHVSTTASKGSPRTGDVASSLILSLNSAGAPAKHSTASTSPLATPAPAAHAQVGPSSTDANLATPTTLPSSQLKRAVDQIFADLENPLRGPF